MVIFAVLHWESTGIPIAHIFRIQMALSERRSPDQNHPISTPKISTNRTRFSKWKCPVSQWTVDRFHLVFSGPIQIYGGHILTYPHHAPIKISTGIPKYRIYEAHLTIISTINANQLSGCLSPWAYQSSWCFSKPRGSPDHPSQHPWPRTDIVWASRRHRNEVVGVGKRGHCTKSSLCLNLFCIFLLCLILWSLMKIPKVLWILWCERSCTNCSQQGLEQFFEVGGRAFSQKSMDWLGQFWPETGWVVSEIYVLTEFPFNSWSDANLKSKYSMWNVGKFNFLAVLFLWRST